MVGSGTCVKQDCEKRCHSEALNEEKESQSKLKTKEFEKRLSPLNMGSVHGEPVFPVKRRI